MNIEIRKAGFVNKGAELMLHAVVQQLRRNCPNARLVMEPSRETGPYPYRGRAELGLYQKAWLWRKNIPFGDLAALVPGRLREMYGVVLDSEIDVVLDAAGFAYTDQWGAELSEELARASRRWKKRGTKVILMPQAFGPFRDERSKVAVKEFVANSDLIFAREPISYKYLTDIVGEQDKIKICPDFTNLLEGTVPEYFNPAIHQIAIVPNYRMMDKTSEAVAKGYVPFLKRAAQMLLDKGAKPFMLVHEGEDDLKLAREVSEAVGGIPVIIEANPLAIKGLLGACRGSVGSRFHGLVSALSQGVPSLATGWSHKYQMLFADYGFEPGILDISMSDAELDHVLEYLTDKNRSQELSVRLMLRSDALKKQSQAMWSDVYKILNNPIAGRQTAPAKHAGPVCS